jgi:hypothetical protein
MSDSNCICFRCKQPLIEMNSYGQPVWGCVSCKLWWLARNPVRSHSVAGAPSISIRHPPEHLTLSLVESGRQPRFATLSRVKLAAAISVTAERSPAVDSNVRSGFLFENRQGAVSVQLFACGQASEWILFL